MEDISSLFEGGALAAGGPTLEAALLSLVMAFVLGQLVAGVYLLTHSGLSYSQTFTQSIVVLTTIVALVILVIGNNVLTAFGLFGALAIIRFRNVLKDTRDTAFVFFALVLGIGTGSGRHALSVLGAVVVCAVIVYLHFTRFGGRHHFDSYLRFLVDEAVGDLGSVRALLRRHCLSWRLVSWRRPPGELLGEASYRLTLRDPQRARAIIDELEATGGVSEVSLVVEQDQSEV